MTVLVVEDSAGYLDEVFVKTLTTEFGEKGSIRGVTLVSEALALIEDPGFVDETDLALVDLELRMGEGKGPDDLEGRDTILRALRERAPWIPVIAVSRYLSGDPLVLSQVSPYGFDVLLPKHFFSESRTYRGAWADVRRLAALNRIAAQTGRTTQDLLALVEKAPENRIRSWCRGGNSTLRY